jgi:hypothetical protein
MSGTTSSWTLGITISSYKLEGEEISWILLDLAWSCLGFHVISLYIYLVPQTGVSFYILLFIVCRSQCWGWGEGFIYCDNKDLLL